MVLSESLFALATALSINLLTSVCLSLSKETSSTEVASATADKTCRDKFESILFSLTSLILSTIRSILSWSPLVITFANNLALSESLSALATALSINLLTSVCPSLSKKVSFNVVASTTADKTCRDKFELSSLLSDIAITFIISWIVAISDFEIILPITSTLLVSDNIWV